MKAKFIRSDMEVSLNPGESLTAEHMAQIEVRSVKRNGRIQKVQFWKNGAVIEHPKCYHLVADGVAVPADEECQLAAGADKATQDAREHAYQRLSLGIDPDDFPAYDAGWMIGYQPDGSWIPGPNHAEYLALHQEEDEDDDGEEE